MIDRFASIASSSGLLAFRRFLLVGLLNTAFGYSIFALVVLAGVDSAIALLFATVCAVFFNYFTTGRLVFATRSIERLPRFVLAYAFTYCANLALLKYLEHLGFQALTAQLICLPPTVVLSFLLFRNFVFPNKEAR